MESDFILKLVNAISKFAHQVEVLQSQDKLRITCDCIYCGRSRRGLPHMGIVIYPEPDGKITGGVNCFRCGTGKPLKSFLFDIKEVLSYYGITASDIYKNVVIKESKESVLNIDFHTISQNAFVEETKFYNWIQDKYKDNMEELRNKIFFNMNGFQFIKNRLKLNFKTSIYEAQQLLKDIKGRVYIGRDGLLILSFDNKIRYIFDKSDPSMVKFNDDRDTVLFGKDEFPYVFNSYTKLKSPPNGDLKYYTIQDSNCDGVDEFDTMNIYVAEGVFDVLSVRFYKNVFNLGEINSIDRNIVNLYIAMAHSRIDKFVSEYFLGILNKRNIIPDTVKSLNFIMIPDLNMNVNRYIFNLYKFIQKHYSALRSFGNDLDIKIYYLDVFDAFSGYGLDHVKDINDIVRGFPKKTLRKIGLVEVL